MELVDRFQQTALPQRPRFKAREIQPLSHSYGDPRA